MIDDDGYRPNVGIVICNRQGQVLWARRCSQHSWQFPQGGINPGETAEQAMYRELFEEVGLSKRMCASWLRPATGCAINCRNVWCVGTQSRFVSAKSKMVLLQLLCNDADINMQRSSTPEFDGWRWVSFWYPVRQVVSFKRDVYRRVMKEFAVTVMPMQEQAAPRQAPLIAEREVKLSRLCSRACEKL